MLSRKQQVHPTPREPLDLSLDSIHLLAPRDLRAPEKRAPQHRSVSLERGENKFQPQPQNRNLNSENPNFYSEQPGAPMADSGFQQQRPTEPMWRGLEGVSGLYGLSRSGASPSQRSLAASHPSASAISDHPGFSNADFRPDPDGAESDFRPEGRQVPTAVDSRQFSEMMLQQSSLVL